MRVKSKVKSDATVCVALFAAAALVRVLFLAATVDRDLPFSVFYYGDSRIYREFALALSRGDVFDQGLPLHPPAFAYVLSWVITWVGERPALMRGVLAAIASSVVPLTYLIGRRIWSRAVGITAAVLATFSFGLCVVSVSANAETIYVPLLAAQALLCVRLGDAEVRGRARNAAWLAVASGLVLGVSSLTRAEHLGLVVFLPAGLAIGWPGIPRRRIAVHAAVIASVGLLTILPWTIHNHRALTHWNAANPSLPEPLPTWVGVSGSGPLIFALGNNARTDGTFRADSAVPSMGQGRIDLSDPAQAAVYLHGYRMGFDFLTGDLRAAAMLMARKAAAASDAFALGFGLSNWPSGLAGTRRPVDVFVPAKRFFKYASLILLAAGIWVSRPVFKRASILVLIPLFVIVVTLASFGYARFFLQFAPFVFLFHAAGLVGLTSRLRTATARRAAVLSGAALALLLVVELAVATAHPRNFRASGSVNPETGRISQDAAVELAPE